MQKQDERGAAPLIALLIILAIAAAGLSALAYWQYQLSTKETGALKGQLAEEQSSKADLEKQVADLQSEKNAKAQEAEAAKQEAEAAKLAALQAPETWATSTIKNLNVTYAYPNDWGKPKLYSLSSVQGDGGHVEFSKLSYPAEGITWASTEFLPDGPPGVFELYMAAQPKDCASLQSAKNDNPGVTSLTIDSCETIQVDSRTITVFHLSYSEMGATGEGAVADNYNVGYVTTANQTYPSVAVGVPATVPLQTVKQVLYSVK
jgi:hypothetical protein